MKKIKFKLSILLFLIGLCFSFIGCEKTIENFKIPNQSPRLVVYAFLNPDSNILVLVSKSMNILEKFTFIQLSNANVYLYENGAFVEELKYDLQKKGYLSTSNFKPEIGKHYKIEVNAENFPTAYGETTIPTLANIDKLEVTHIPSNNELRQQLGLDSIVSIKISLNDPLEQNNYYSITNIQTPIKDDYSNMSSSSSFYFKNPLVELIGYGNNFYTYEFYSDELGYDIQTNYSYATYIAFSDEKINGKKINIELFIEKYKFLNSELCFYSLSDDLYKFMKSKALYSGDSFFSERVQMWNNVKNGFGLVVGYTTVSKKINVLNVTKKNN